MSRQIDHRCVELRQVGARIELAACYVDQRAVRQQGERVRVGLKGARVGSGQVHGAVAHPHHRGEVAVPEEVGDQLVDLDAARAGGEERFTKTWVTTEEGRDATLN